mgnify:CR=1 FL=1
MDKKTIDALIERISTTGVTGPGNARVKTIVTRMIRDLMIQIDELDIQPEEFWAGLNFLSEAGRNGELGLIAPGIGIEHFLDLRMDEAEARAGLKGGTPRTIEGPLYVAGAPVAKGFARLDDGSDKAGHTLVMHGTVFAADGKPLPNATVEVWHANTKGFYSHFDPTGEQQPFNMRRTIVTDAQGRYKFQSIVPVGYGCPPDGPTQALLNQLGRHGNRPAHIHFFVTAEGHRKLTTQINIDGDPLVNDDFAYATREGLIGDVTFVEGEAAARDRGFQGNRFAEVNFDFQLQSAPVPDAEQRNARPRALQ